MSELPSWKENDICNVNIESKYHSIDPDKYKFIVWNKGETEEMPMCDWFAYLQRVVCAELEIKERVPYTWVLSESKLLNEYIDSIEPPTYIGGKKLSTAAIMCDWNSDEYRRYAIRFIEQEYNKVLERIYMQEEPYEIDKEWDEKVPCIFSDGYDVHHYSVHLKFKIVPKEVEL